MQKLTMCVVLAWCSWQQPGWAQDTEAPLLRGTAVEAALLPAPGDPSARASRAALEASLAALAAPAPGSPFGAAALAPDQLDGVRGGSDGVWNDMKLNGAVTGNAALNVGSGMNQIANGSFANAAGLPVAIQNSGANVLIQNATIINIQMQ